VIYFIRSPDGPIKIGTTIRLTERLKKLAAEYGEGLEVLAVVEGDRNVEKELHGRFAHLRQVGEWFEPGDDLLGFILAEAMAWDGSDEKPLRDPSLVTVKLDRAIVAKCRYVAEVRGITLAEFLSDAIRPVADREFARVSKVVAE
jgi:hypothetical protein